VEKDDQDSSSNEDSVLFEDVDQPKRPTKDASSRPRKPNSPLDQRPEPKAFLKIVTSEVENFLTSQAK
jgi:hypothetical protein